MKRELGLIWLMLKWSHAASTVIIAILESGLSVSEQTTTIAVPFFFAMVAVYRQHAAVQISIFECC